MRPRISGKDLATGVPQTFGLGFGIVPESLPLSPNKNTCYWDGWGGSAVVTDQDARQSAAAVLNKIADGLNGDVRSFKLLAETDTGFGYPITLSPEAVVTKRLPDTRYTLSNSPGSREIAIA